jgi:elongation factor G
MGITTNAIRNVAFAGHSGTGKTTLVEHLLYIGGVIPKPETIEGGKTVSDFLEEEVVRHISIRASLTHLIWKEKKLNMLDTPGSGDFIGEIIAASRAVESTLLIIGADSGIQIGTIKLWRRLNEWEMPRMVFINKMDKEHANFNDILEDLKEKFKINFIPVSLPIGNATTFKGVVNLLNNKAYTYQGSDKPQLTDIPADMQAEAIKQRQALIEAAAEGDDGLMEKYLEQGNLSEEEIVKGLKLALQKNSCVPVFAGAATLNIGLIPLLDFIAEIAPFPQVTAKALNTKGEELSVKINPQGSLSSLVFKTTIDQFSGKESYIKVITGKVVPDSEIYDVRANHKEKVSKIYTAQGKKLEEVNEIIAGDIGILTKITTANTNDSLCSPDFLVQFKPTVFPHPPHSVAITATSKKDEDKLGQLLQREAEEDPTFTKSFNPETKETVISTMGELQLQIFLDKLKNKQKIDYETKIPKVAYRETVTKTASAEFQHKKQTGGHGQYARVTLDIAPIERGQHFKFVNAIFGGVVSRGYIPGVEKGIIEGMEAGILAGYPVVDIEAKLVDGKEHPVDSSELAFKLAARGALKEAMEKANPVLLEPVMNLEIFVDEKYLGDVLSDLSSRRGRVQGQEPLGGGIISVKAQVPQAELLHYAIDLKSITSGTAAFEVSFDHYNPITGKIADDVIKAAKAEHEEAHQHQH